LIAGVSKHQYYYKSVGCKRGKNLSEKTLKFSVNKTEKVDNIEVVKEIKEIKKDPDKNYGYRKMTYELLLRGYIINHKKVYRLMKENQLLREKHKKQKREFVKYRKVMPTGPLECFEMDIKYVWVEKDKRHCYILSVIDTFTRVVVGWTYGYRIKQEQVKKLWERIIVNHLQPYDCLNRNINIEIRNDNDSRFIAHAIQEFFKENHINQVFTHPYTPQENGHIESFHAILSEKLSRYSFWSLDELEKCLILFYEKYNNERIHSSICYLPPMIFWKSWEKEMIEALIDKKKRQIKFRLLVPHYKLLGDLSLREVLSYHPIPLDGVEDDKKIITFKMDGTIPFKNHRSKIAVGRPFLLQI
jgi:transposase InsO family protein